MIIGDDIVVQDEQGRERALREILEPSEFYLCECIVRREAEYILEVAKIRRDEIDDRAYFDRGVSGERPEPSYCVGITLHETISGEAEDAQCLPGELVREYNDEEYRRAKRLEEMAEGTPEAAYFSQVRGLLLRWYVRYGVQSPGEKRRGFWVPYYPLIGWVYDEVSALNPAASATKKRSLTMERFHEQFPALLKKLKGKQGKTVELNDTTVRRALKNR